MTGSHAGSEVYKGAFGDWSVDENDVKEVVGYRAGLSVAALGGSYIALLPVDMSIPWKFW